MDKLPGRDSRIIGQVKRPRRWPKVKLPHFSKKVVLIVLAIVVLAVTGIVAASVLTGKNNAKKENASYGPMIKLADAELRNGDQRKAKERLEKYLREEKPKDKDHLYNIEIRLGSIYRILKDYRNAKKWGELALTHATKPTLDNYILLAESSQFLNDKSAAIGYYEKAIELLNNQKSLSGAAQKRGMEIVVQQLKAENK